MGAGWCGGEVAWAAAWRPHAPPWGREGACAVLRWEGHASSHPRMPGRTWARMAAAARPALISVLPTPVLAPHTHNEGCEMASWVAPAVALAQPRSHWQLPRLSSGKHGAFTAPCNSIMSPCGRTCWRDRWYRQRRDAGGADATLTHINTMQFKCISGGRLLRQHVGRGEGGTVMK